MTANSSTPSHCEQIYSSFKKTFFCLAHHRFSFHIFRPFFWDTLKMIASFEKEYASNAYNGHPKASPYAFYSGTLPMIISAPHAVSHFRNGKNKKPEVYTGAITRYLHETSGIHALIHERNDFTDPNWISGKLYREKLSRHIQQKNLRFLLDLHALHPRRESEIILCTNSFKNLQHQKHFTNIFVDIFKKHGFFKIEIDTLYQASAPYNISRTIATTQHIPCLQIEINAKLIDPHYQKGVPLKKVLQALSMYVRKISQHDA